MELQIKKQINNLLMVLGAYGILQVLAQDLGVKTGKKQRDLVQSPIILLLILYGGAFLVTQDHILAVVTMGLYYGLKYIYSGGKTSEVCFEDV